MSLLTIPVLITHLEHVIEGRMTSEELQDWTFNVIAGEVYEYDPAHQAALSAITFSIDTFDLFLEPQAEFIKTLKLYHHILKDLPYDQQVGAITIVLNREKIADILTQVSNGKKDSQYLAVALQNKGLSPEVIRRLEQHQDTLADIAQALTSGQLPSTLL